MKRCTLIITLSAMLFAALSAGAAPTRVKDSKHNLSASGPGTYKAQSPAAGGTTEICVFCHTPHGGNTEAPLWNRSTTQTGYVPYTSDVMSLLSITAENPSTGSASAIHIKKTRVCLTCHDGTVALGKLVVMPSDSSGTEIAMTPNVKIQQQDAGYIGLDLRDDHPVAVQHDSGKDTELKSPISPSTKVRLYTVDAGSKIIETKYTGGYVECTSCHDPHDNQFGNFLIDSNHGSNICISCHNKTGFTGSAHDDNAINATYTPPDGVGGYLSGSPTGKVGDVKCMSCHFPHKSGVVPGSTMPNAEYGRYLLSFREENSCFLNNPSDRWGTSNAPSACHGIGGWKNIESDVNSSGLNIHPIKDTSSTPRHKATEGQSAGWFKNSSDQHVECEDCHNPHTAGITSHSSPIAALAPPLDASSPLYGTGGAKVTNFPASNFGAPDPLTQYAYLKPRGVTDSSTGVEREYQICLKCHSAYAWYGGTAPNSTSLGSVMTDQAQEFNNNNSSYHPIVAANNKNTQGSTGLTGWTANFNNQTMYCSDCHTRSGGGTPAGTHGSSNPFILAGSFADSYGTVGVNHQDAQDGANGLCFRCHLMNVYSSPAAVDHLVAPATDTGFRDANGYNLHNQHRWEAANLANKRAYRCVNCHVRVAHGWKRKALIVLQGDGNGFLGAPYEAGGANTGLIVTSTFPAPGSYTINSCGSSLVSNGITGCHP